MKELNDERLMKDILKKSDVELSDPAFGEATMKRVFRENRKRTIIDSVLRNALIFVATDAIIYLILKLTGLSIDELVGVSVNFLNRMLFRAGELKAVVPGSDSVVYLILSFVGIVMVLTFIELRFDSWNAHKRRTTW